MHERFVLAARCQRFARQAVREERAWRGIMLKPVVLAFAVLLSHVPADGATTLTKAAELDQQKVAQDVEDFWRARGVVGSFTGARGVTISYATVIQPDRSSEMGALVIVSGRTESMLKYKELARDLWNNGWSIYIHDHRGQGLSDREPEVQEMRQRGHVHEFDDYVRDLRSFVADKVLTSGHKRHVLLAHSMGGAITSLFLESGWPEVRRFDSAVLSSPMLKIKGVGGAPADILSCRIAKKHARIRPVEYVPTGGDYAPKDFQDNEYTQSPVRYKRLLDQVAAASEIKLGSPTVRWFDQACEAAFRARTQADRVRTPIRVFVAGNDSIVHNDGAREFCKGLVASLGGCGGPGGGPIEVSGARHELFIEQDGLREQAVGEALKFFARQEATKQ